MTLKEFLNKKGVSMHQVSVHTNIPYSTVKEIFNAKSDFKKARVETAIRLAEFLNTTVEELYAIATKKKRD